MSTIPTFQEMWSRYLFDQNISFKGDELLDESIIRDNIIRVNEKGEYYQTDTEGSTLEISASEFMQEGNPGSFINGANFSVVNNFFSGELLNTAKLRYIAENSDGAIKIDEDGTIRFTLKQMLSINEESLGFDNFNTPNASKSISQRQFRPDDESVYDFAQRVQLFETTGFQLGTAEQGQYDEQMEFIIRPDGIREISNFVIVPSSDDNFDFVGGNGEGLQQAGNQPLPCQSRSTKVQVMTVSYMY